MVLPPRKLEDKTRGIQLKTPEFSFTEPKKEIVCTGIGGHEELGRLFEYHLDIKSDYFDIDFTKYLGKRMTVRFEMPELTPRGMKMYRYFDGFVTEFSFSGSESGQFYSYEAVLRPWLWFLTKTSNCRIFQEKDAIEIIKEVFQDNGMSDFEFKTTKPLRKRTYCVQYRESDFNFVSRLMEEEGIYYFFKHESGKHDMIVVDDNSSHMSFGPDYGTIQFLTSDTSAMRDEDGVQHWARQQHIVPNKFAVTDYDFEKPKTGLEVKSEDKPNEIPFIKGDVFDYPGGYVETTDGDQYIQRRREELQSQFDRIMATGDARGLMAGCTFTLKGHPREAENVEYLIVSVTHHAEIDSIETSGGGDADFYTCDLVAVEKSKQFRSERITPKPVVQGLQTAMVVGPEGDEIFCDKYGRVKVLFHWDREGKAREAKENSSCWMRVSQLWAGVQFGGFQVPRIDEEVLVSFLEGDPDQPLITGRVHNADEMPTYELPANMTRSGIKTHSTKEATDDNYNELRFEDKLDEEEVYFHAEKDMNVVIEHKRRTIIGYDKRQKNDVSKRHDLYQLKGSRLVTIEGNERVYIKATKQQWDPDAETNNENKEYPANKALLTAGGVAKTGRDVKIEGGTGDKLLIEKSEQGREVVIKSGEGYKMELNAVKTGRDVKIHGSDANDKLVVALGDISAEAEAGKILYKAAQEIKLECGGSTITLTPSKISIKTMDFVTDAGMTVKIKAGMTAELKGEMSAKIKGGMTAELAGGILASVKGAIVKIN
jgi:type VI secretion system secreted protein VgrG